MSLFVTYDAQAYEYNLTGAGYGALVILMLLALIVPICLTGKKDRRMSTKQLVFCAIAMALGIVTSFIKFVDLPFGGSITLFSMFFICLIGYLYGPKIGLMTGVAYGILQLLIEPYIYAPLQLLLDYPLAFGALGLSGLFWKSRRGLAKGCVVGVIGRYVCHVISGYVFFASYAPEGMNPMVYTLGYNATYILPEMIATLVLISIPAVGNALNEVKRMARQ
ncbi:MAG: energy-coupled thiamine transporter ThiT [Eubacteriales bacterium]|nr:energy-coupled thiamine transporter ThiT [Eubacteriales bacterium]